MVTSRAGALDGGAPYQSDRSFGKLLEWHLYVNGTRPDGQPGQAGDKWTPQRFAGAVGAKSTNTLGNWLADRGTPWNIDAVELALFGDNKAYATWRDDLRTAWNNVREVSAKNRSTSDQFFVGAPTRIVPFVGRKDNITAIEMALNPQNPIAGGYYAVVFGLGGLGKTSLASEYAHATASRYHGVWWFSATSRNEIQLNLIRLAEHLNLHKIDEKNIELAAKLCVQAISKYPDRLLLIYDNVETPADIEGLLPSGNARIIVTTRFSEWSPHHLVELDLLSLEQSSELLLAAAGRPDQEGAQILSKTLGRLPLALSQAAATCKLTGLSFRAYAEKADALLPHAPTKSNYPNSVYSTFKLAIEAAEVRSPGAEKLMYLLGYCSPESIPTSLVIPEQGADATDIGALTTLIEFSLAQRADFEHETPAIRVHRLVQSVARDRADKGGDRKSVLPRLVRALRAAFPSRATLDVGKAAWPPSEKLLPHVLALAHRIEAADNPPEVDILFDAAAKYAEARGMLNEAIVLAQTAMTHCERHQTSEIGYVTFTARFAELLDGNGQTLEAVRIFSELEQYAITKDTADKSTRASIYMGLAKAYLHSGSFTKAEAAYTEAEKYVSDEKNDDVAFLIEIGGLKLQYHQFDEAERIAIDVLQRVQKLQGVDHWKVAESFFNLALVYQAKGNFAASIPYLRNAFVIQERKFGRANPATCRTLEHLGLAVSQARPQENWELCFELAVQGLADAYGEHHPKLAGCFNHYGIALYNAQRYAAAAEKYDLALNILTPLYGDAHQSVLPLLSNLSELLIEQGMHAEALPYLERAAQGCIRLHGWRHERTITAHQRYAFALGLLGRRRESEAVLSSLKMALEKNLPSTSADF